MSAFNERMAPLRELMKQKGLESIVLRRNPNLAWAIAGRAHVPTTIDAACFDLIITQDSATAITNVVEAPRLIAASQDAMPQQISHFVIAIDASKLSVDGNNNRTNEFTQEVKAAGGRLPGSNRVNPENLNSGDEITITDQVSEQLKTWSTKLGI